MDFEFSTLGVEGNDINRWENLLSRLDADIYYSPKYLSLFDGKDSTITERFGMDPKLIVYGNEDNFVINPILKKPINTLAFYPKNRENDTDKQFYDIVSPWYYGGPLVTYTDEKNRKSLVEGYFSHFDEYCISENIISEFTRLHPLLKNNEVVEQYLKPEMRNKIVYVDLMQDEEDIWNAYKKENRKSINRSQKRGVEVVISRKKEDIEKFYRLYTDAMKRLNADKAYYLSLDFFNNLFNNLNEKVQLFIALYEGEMIAGSILIAGNEISHDYLRAFNPDSSVLVPNNLIVHNKIMWAKKNGYKIFSLQGGHGMDDGIFRFKLTFSQLTADYYTYSVIHKPKEYDYLSGLKREYNALTNQVAASDSYFPFYRQ